jgi:hypothetical protein
MRIALLPVVAAAALSLAACDVDFTFAAGRYIHDFHYTYPLDPGGRLSVETFNGAVEIVAWDQNTVEISGTKHGPTQWEADNLPVAIDHSPASISIRVERPSSRRGNLGAQFVIQVPRSTVLDRLTTSNGAIRVTGGTGPTRLRTSNGSIRVNALGGSLEATTSNGPITAELARVDGPVRAETSNGSIDLRLPARLNDEVRAHTSNGGITVRLPEGLDARLSAHTSNARISSDFDLRLRGEIGRNRVEAVVGNGGPLITLGTSNGGINLKRF